jgi:hypothetical protein
LLLSIRPVRFWIRTGAPAEPDSQHYRRDDSLAGAARRSDDLPQQHDGLCDDSARRERHGCEVPLFIATTVSSGSHTIVTASASDVYKGFAHLFGDDTSALGGFSTTTGVTITMDGSTRGGFAGDVVELEDVATNVWAVRIYGHATGTEATPFS